MAGGTHIIRMRKRQEQMRFILDKFTEPVFDIGGFGEMAREQDGYCPTGITFALINSRSEDLMVEDRLSYQQFSNFMAKIQSYLPTNLRVRKDCKEIWRRYTFNDDKMSDETRVLLDDCIEWYHDMRAQALNNLSFQYYTQGKNQFLEIMKRRWKNEYSEKIEQSVQANVEADTQINLIIDEA